MVFKLIPSYIIYHMKWIVRTKSLQEKTFNSERIYMLVHRVSTLQRHLNKLLIIIVSLAYWGLRFALWTATLGWPTGRQEDGHPKNWRWWGWALVRPWKYFTNLDLEIKILGHKIRLYHSCHLYDSRDSGSLMFGKATWMASEAFFTRAHCDTNLLISGLIQIDKTHLRFIQ
jgi:hypothetical protein